MAVDQIRYWDSRMTVLDEARTRYEDDRDTVDGTIRPELDGDTLVRDTILRLHARVADGTVNGEDLQLLGRHLYYLLFDGQTRAAFEKSYDFFRKNADANARLRLVLAFHADAKEIGALPWEFLYLPRRGNTPGFFVCAEKRTELILTRFVPETSVNERFTPENTKKLRVLVVVSGPRQLDALEVGGFIQRLEALGARIEVRLLSGDEGEMAATLDGIEANAADFRPHILHFIGHGDAELGIALHKTRVETDRYRDEHGGELRDADWTGSRELSARFPRPGPRLVFLHACEGASAGSVNEFSSMARELVESYGVPAVVAMQYPISNEAAGLFAQTFYQQIADGTRLDIAATEGRWAVRQSPYGEWGDRSFGTPLVYLQSDSAILIHDDEEEIAPARHLPQCPHGCGRLVEPDAEFCSKCGNAIARCVKGHLVRAGATACAEGDEVLAPERAQPNVAASQQRGPTQVERAAAGAAPEAVPPPRPADDRRDPLRPAIGGRR